MELSLRIIINETGETRDLEIGKLTTIGRGQNSRIQIKQGYISMKHAEITQTDSGNYFISDLGSKNGTFVNDELVEEPTALKAGDVLRFGLAACEVVETEPEILSESGVSTDLTTRMIPSIKGGRRARKTQATRHILYAGREGSSKKARSTKKKAYLATGRFQNTRSGRDFYSPTASR